MISIYFKYGSYRKYTESPSCIVSGKGFYKGKYYEGEDFNQLVSPWTSKEEFLAGIDNLNGFYTIIKKEKTYLFAAVDRVRSIPLFYGQKGNEFFLSDCAEWIRTQVGDNELDPIAKEEFLLTGYVTGQDTLFQNVKQLQAGEALFVQNNEKKLNIRTERYYKFMHKYEDNKNFDELMTEHDKVLVNVFNRLINFANGRTLVIPLSGGYDSRLIVLMLKRLGYDNIITFSYGRPGNAESEVSRKVAESLGLRWEFIPYSNEDWYKWFNSDERKAYWDFGSGLSSLPHIQDWPAVWQLKEKDLIPKDSIFVPGHTGDFISGGHIPIDFAKQKNIKDQDLLESIIKKHYCLFDFQKTSKTIGNRLESKISNLSKATKNQSALEAACKYEKWEWQERQAKFIVNSARVYDYWNYDWWLPLWDYEYMQFWCNVPLLYRVNQIMYMEYVNKLSSEITGQTFPRDTLNPSYGQQLKKTMSPHINSTIKAKLKDILYKNNKALVREYNSHPLAWWGMYSFDEYILNAKDYVNINSAIAMDYIKAYEELRMDIAKSK